ncbi:MAG: hypothetical protein AB2793_16040, partial [Candidatus Thiodiazotropha sp.]
MDEILEKIQDAISVPEEPTQEEVQETQEAKESEETEATETDSEESGKPESEESESELEEETEEIELDADVFASALGLEDNALDITDEGEIKFKTKIDGKENAVTLAELLKGYQLEGHVTQKSQKLSEDRRAFEQERDAQMTELKSALGQATELLKLSEEGLIAEYNIDWNTLRTENPAEFAAKRQEFQERYNQIQ